MSYNCNCLKTNKGKCACRFSLLFAVLARKYSDLIGGLCFEDVLQQQQLIRKEFTRVFAVSAWKYSSMIGGYRFQDVLQLQQPQN
jgi:hypothetical protein